jgi:hypothetical protein
MPAERDAQRSASAGWSWTGAAQRPLSCGIGDPQELTVACLRGIAPAAAVLVPLGRLDKEDTVIVADVSFGDIF